MSYYWSLNILLLYLWKVGSWKVLEPIVLWHHRFLFLFIFMLWKMLPIQNPLASLENLAHFMFWVIYFSVLNLNGEYLIYEDAKVQFQFDELVWVLQSHLIIYVLLNVFEVIQHLHIRKQDKYTIKIYICWITFFSSKWFNS